MEFERKIFEFSNLREFLKSYNDQKLQQNPHWSYGVWSRKLGVTNLATLTRVVSGERSPGEELLAKFIQYFDFTESEKEYFELLVHLEKLSDAETLHSLVVGQLQHLRTINGVVAHPYSTQPLPTESPVLWFRKTHLVYVQGTARVDALKTYLEPRGLVPVDFGGRGIVGLSMCRREESLFGPFTEFYVVYVVKRVGIDSAPASVTFSHLLSSNSQLSSLWKIIWEVDYGQGHLDFYFSEENSGHVLVNGTSGIICKIGYGRSSDHPFETTFDNSKMLAYPNRNTLQNPYTIDVNAKGTKRRFDSKVDSITVIDSELKAHLSILDFVPDTCFNYPALSATVYRPCSG